MYGMTLVRRSNISISTLMRSTAAVSPAASRSSSSFSIASSSSGFGRRSEMRRAMLLRMVRRTLRLAGEPAMVKPARWRSVALVSFSVFLTRSGSSRSSKNMSRNSCFERVNSKESSPEPSGLPSEPPPPLPPVGRGISSPTTYSLLPVTTYSLRPVRREGRLADPLARDRHLLAIADLGDLALAQRLLHRRLQLSASRRDEALAIAEALALRVRTTVDDIHQICLSARYPALLTLIY